MIGLYLAIIDDPEEKIRFEDLYNQYKGTLIMVANQILNDMELSEDAVQETFFSLARNMGKISDKNCIQIRNYLIIIVRNAAYRIYNKRKGDIYTNEIEEDIPDLQNIEIDVEDKAAQQKLMELIKTLDEKYADVLILKYLYDLPDKEIARSLGISLENAKIRLHRGKIMLKNKLLEADFYDGETV